MARILPREEYDRLIGTEAEQVWPHLKDTDVVVVVEDGGRIVACHVLMQMWHLECLWVAPDRRKSMVGGRLWAKVQQTAKSMGLSALWTSAISDEVRDLLAHVGAEELPGRHYRVPMRG